MQPEVIQVVPDTPMSVLALFSTSKEGIEKFSNMIAEEVIEGRANALDVHLYLKTLEKIAETVQLKIKEHTKTEAAKWGEKPFMYKGAEVHYKATKTDYDYSNDVRWDNLRQAAQAAIDKQKAREVVLKAMKEPVKEVDEDTGAVEIVTPAVKEQVMGVSITFK